MIISYVIPSKPPRNAHQDTSLQVLSNSYKRCTLQLNNEKFNIEITYIIGTYF